MSYAWVKTAPVLLEGFGHLSFVVRPLVQCVACALPAERPRLGSAPGLPVVHL